MVRETSGEAYRTIQENGLLSKRRMQVYAILFQNGPLAGAQVAYLFSERHGKTARSETVRNRITELRDMGVVKEVGFTTDPNTKMRVTTWDVTSKLPVKLPDKVSKSAIISQQAKTISVLENKVAELELELDKVRGNARL